MLKVMVLGLTKVKIPAVNIAMEAMSGRNEWETKFGRVDMVSGEAKFRGWKRKGDEWCLQWRMSLSHPRQS